MQSLPLATEPDSDVDEPSETGHVRHTIPVSPLSPWQMVLCWEGGGRRLNNKAVLYNSEQHNKDDGGHGDGHSDEETNELIKTRTKLMMMMMIVMLMVMVVSMAIMSMTMIMLMVVAEVVEGVVVVLVCGWGGDPYP